MATSYENLALSEYLGQIVPQMDTEVTPPTQLPISMNVIYIEDRPKDEQFNITSTNLGPIDPTVYSNDQIKAFLSVINLF